MTRPKEKEKRASSSEGEERVEKKGEAIRAANLLIKKSTDQDLADSAFAGSPDAVERVAPEETGDAPCVRNWPVGNKINICYSCGHTFRGPGWKIRPLCACCDVTSELSVLGSGECARPASTDDGSTPKPSGVSEVGQAEKEKVQDSADAPTQRPQGQQPEEVRGNASGEK